MRKYFIETKKYLLITFIGFVKKMEIIQKRFKIISKEDKDRECFFFEKINKISLWDGYQYSGTSSDGTSCIAPPDMRPVGPNTGYRGAMLSVSVKRSAISGPTPFAKDFDMNKLFLQDFSRILKVGVGDLPW